MAEEVGGIVYEVGMDVSGLKAGVSSAESALGKVDSAAQDTTKNLDKLDNQASSTGKSFSSLVSIVKNIDATLSKMASSSGQVSGAVQQTSQSAEQANQVIAALNTQIAMMQNQHAQAAVSTQRLETSINATTAAIRELGQQAGSTTPQISGVERMIEGLGNQVAILEEQMENGARSAAIFAAQLRAGDGATAQQKQQIADLTGRLYDMKNGTDSAGKSTGGFRTAMQQGGYQIQDFIVQVQGGQSALVAFSQQGSQLAGAFGAGGAVFGAVLALSTVVAGSLIAALNGGKNAIDAMNDAISTMDKVITISSNGVAAYSDKYQQLARANTQVATLMRQQAQLELQAALSKVSKEVTKASSDFIGFGDALVSSLGGGYASVKLFNDYLSTLNITTNDFSVAMKQASAAGAPFQSTTQSMIATVGALASKFDLSDQKAFEFAKQLSDIAKNPSDEKLKSLVVTLQQVGERQSKGAATAREYAAKLLEIATTSADASVRLKALKDMTDNLTSSQDKALQQARQTLFIEKQTGVEKLKAQAYRDAENQGLKQGTQAFREYYNVRLQTYQQQEANAQAAKDEAAANRENASALKSAASEQESIAQKLQKLKEASMLSASSTQELSREQTILRAEQSLGKGATQDQIKLAGEYAAQAYDVAAALKAQQAAEKQRQETEKNYQQIRATASPVSGLDSQFQEQMASLNAYAQLYPQKIAEVEQTRANIEAQYREQRMALMWTEWQQQNLAAQLFGETLDASLSTVSNSITGVLTGTQSINDALANVATTVLNTVVNSFVQMGADWVRSAVMGQTATTAAVAASTAAQTAGLATTTAASTASAATTTAAWTPAAIVASIGSFGGAAAIGLGAVLGALAMGVAGKRKNGGPMSAGSMYEVGENGLPEIFQASNGRQYMVPGNNGQMFSNKDVTSGSGSSGGGLVVYNNVTNNANARVSTSATQNGDGSVTISTIVDDIQSGGQISQAISTQFDTQRRATE